MSLYKFSATESALGIRVVKINVVGADALTKTHVDGFSIDGVVGLAVNHAIDPANRWWNVTHQQSGRAAATHLPSRLAACQCMLQLATTAVRRGFESSFR